MSDVPQARARILVVDDVELVRRALERTLVQAGYEIVGVGDAREALRLLDGKGFDLLLTDLHMPDFSGIQLLESLRDRDMELPVILLTGAPSTETAISAVNLAATAYLKKPLDTDELLAAVARALRFRRLAAARREALASTIPPPKEAAPPRQSQIERSFDQALAGLFIVFQPIVRWSERVVYGFEALARSSDPTLGNPMALFDAAEQLERLDILGRKIRRSCVDAVEASEVRSALFVNLHPHDLLDETLYDGEAPLSRIARRVVLEITERAKLDEISDLKQRVERLRRLGFRIAVDDIGAGYSGLTSFVTLQPDLVKLDMALVRDVHLESVKRQLIRLVLDLCKQLDISVVAEGVETAEERDALLDLGCDLFQGYLFAAPAVGFPSPRM